MPVVQLDVRSGSVDTVDVSDISKLPKTKMVPPSASCSSAPSRPSRKATPGGYRDPVYYIDKKGDVHIDFTNLAGFIANPMGAILSRSVTPD